MPVPTDRAFVAALALVVSAPAWLAAQTGTARDVPTLEIVSTDGKPATFTFKGFSISDKR